MSFLFWDTNSIKIFCSYENITKISNFTVGENNCFNIFTANFSIFQSYIV